MIKLRIKNKAKGLNLTLVTFFNSWDVKGPQKNYSNKKLLSPFRSLGLKQEN